MKLIIISLLLTILCSCASKTKQVPEIGLDMQVFHNPTTGKMSVRNNYLNTDKLYVHYLKEKQILSDVSLSCFNDPRSINYIDIPEIHIDLIRKYAIDQEYKINYKTVTYQDSDHFMSKQYEVREDNLKVKQKHCIKTVNNKDVFVNSEIYN